MDLLTRLQEMEARRLEDLRRRQADRIRTIVTAVHEADPDEPASFFYVQVKATWRLCQAMAEYKARYGREGFTCAPSNVCPQYGPQLRIGEEAVERVTGWTVAELYEGEPEQLVGLLADLVRGLTGYYPQVQFAGRFF